MRQKIFAAFLMLAAASLALAADDIFDLARFGPEHDAEKLIEKDPGLLESMNEVGTPLMVASNFGKEEMVIFFLGKGADPNAKAEEGWTALHFAAFAGHPNTTRILLEHGAKVNALGEQSVGTPLHQAAYLGHADVAKILFEHGADPNAETGNYGVRPIHIAAERGHKEFMDLLAKEGADQRAETNEGKDVLFFAARGGQNELVAELIDKGFKADKLDHHGSSPLNEAMVDGNTAAARILIDHGADVNSASKRARDYPVLVAAGKGHLELAKLLIEKGADTGVKDNLDNTLLHQAARGGLFAIAEELIEKGADVDARNALGQTPLHLAVDNVHLKTMDMLIEKGADINARDDKGRTVLTLCEGRWDLRWTKRKLERMGAVE